MSKTVLKIIAGVGVAVLLFVVLLNMLKVATALISYHLFRIIVRAFFLFLKLNHGGRLILAAPLT